MGAVDIWSLVDLLWGLEEANENLAFISATADNIYGNSQ